MCNFLTGGKPADAFVSIKWNINLFKFMLINNQKQIIAIATKAKTLDSKVRPLKNIEITH